MTSIPGRSSPSSLLQAASNSSNSKIVAPAAPRKVLPPFGLMMSHIAMSILSYKYSPCPAKSSPSSCSLRGYVLSICLIMPTGALHRYFIN